jgi:hypothetical protein
MNAATAQTKPASRQVTGLDSWRLGNRPRKTVLLLHIVAGGTWFGLDVAMAVLVFTGILLGLGSKYGLVRYWWVASKLVLNLLLATLIVTALRGEVANAAGLGGELALGADLDWNFTNMIYPPIVSPTALTIAFLLAIFKPWGRIRRRTGDQ